jgi:hypothetical protein
VLAARDLSGVGGIVTWTAGATTRFSYFCGATKCKEIPESLSTLSNAEFRGTGVVAPPPPKPCGLNPMDWPFITTPPPAGVKGVSLPVASRVSLVRLVTAPIVRGPMVSPSVRLTVLATTVPSTGAISAFEVARPTFTVPGDWRPALADALLVPGELDVLIWTRRRRPG